MSLISQINNMSMGGGNREYVNVALRVTGYHLDNSNPQNNRILGIRIDNKEQCEIRIEKNNSPNQPTVKSVSQNANIGGTVFMQGSFIDKTANRIDSDSSYVVTCRWPNMVTPNAHEGKAVVAMARIATPFIRQDGGISMNVDVLGKNPVTIKSMEDFNHHFFENLQPERPLGALPFVAVRFTEKEGNGSAIETAFKTFGPVLKGEADGFGAAELQTTYNEYMKNGTPENQKLTLIRSQVEQFLNSPSVDIEIIPIHKYTVGSKTKMTVVKKMNEGLSPSAWPCRPTIMDADDYTGFTPCLIGLRQASGGGHIVARAMPLHERGLITRAGITSQADLERHNVLHHSTSQKPEQQQAPQKQQHTQQTPAQQQAPQKQQYTQQTPVQQQAPQKQQYAQQTPVQQQAPQKQQYAQQTPEQQEAPQEQQYTQQTPTQEQYSASSNFQKPIEASTQQQQPVVDQANPQQRGFEIHPVDDQWFVIAPPNIDPGMESSLLTNLSTIAKPLEQNEVWYFPLASRHQVTESLQLALNVLANSRQEYGVPIKNHMVQSSPALDYADLGNEIDSMFGSDQRTNGMNH